MPRLPLKPQMSHTGAGKESAPLRNKQASMTAWSSLLLPNTGAFHINLRVDLVIIKTLELLSSCRRSLQVVAHHGRLVCIQLRFGRPDRESNFFKFGGYSPELGDIRHYPLQGRSAKRSYEVSETEDRSQESKCAISNSRGNTTPIPPEYSRLISSIAYRHVCEKWRLSLFGRDCFQRIHGQSHIASQSLRIVRAQRRRKEQNLRTHSELGKRNRRSQ